MKFIADAMLGRLAKHLRLLGHDVSYDPSLDDNGIIQRSLEEDRTILTRDRGLAARPLAARSILVRDDHIDGQIEQLIALLPNGGPGEALTRCSACNAFLESVDLRDVRDQLPDHVAWSHRTFTRCINCGKVYWKGSHTARMRASKAENEKGRSRRT